MVFDFKKEYKEFYMPMEMCYSSSMRLQKQFISTFMCVASFEKTVRKGLGNFPTRGICITDALLANIVFGEL